MSPTKKKRWFPKTGFVYGVERQPEKTPGNPSLWEKAKNTARRWAGLQQKRHDAKESSIHDIAPIKGGAIVVPDSIKTLKSVYNYTKLLEQKRKKPGKDSGKIRLSSEDMIKLIQLKKSENNIKIFEAEINRVGREMEAIKSGTKKRLNSEKSVQNLLARTGSEVEKTRVQFAWLLEWADGNLEKYARELIGKRDKQIFELNAQLNGMENRRIIETYNRIRMEGELEVLNRIDNSFADRPKDVAEIYRLKRKEKIQEQKRKVQ